MEPRTLNILLDIILIAASIWMIFSVRGVGGVVGKTLSWIVVGTVILGVAHLLATLTGSLFAPWGGSVHRVVVLVGFLLVVMGFRQISVMKR